MNIKTTYLSCHHLDQDCVSFVSPIRFVGTVGCRPFIHPWEFCWFLTWIFNPMSPTTTSCHGKTKDITANLPTWGKFFGLTIDNLVSQIGSSPQEGGENIKCLKPPPRSGMFFAFNPPQNMDIDCKP